MSRGTHTNESCHAYETVMSRIRMSRVTDTNESCHAYKWVMSHIWKSHVTHTNGSCHTYERVMSHKRMSDATHMNESARLMTSRVTYEWVVSHRDAPRHVWMSHVTYERVWHTWIRHITYESVMSLMNKLRHFGMTFVTSIISSDSTPPLFNLMLQASGVEDATALLQNLKAGGDGSGIWLVHMCDMTNKNDSYLWHDSFICETWLILVSLFSHGNLDDLAVRSMTYSHVWRDSFICVTWLIRMCDTTYSWLWHDPFICETWLILVCLLSHGNLDDLAVRSMTHSHVWRDSFICVAWFRHMCDMTPSYVWHDSFICVTWLIHMCGMTPS